MPYIGRNVAPAINAEALNDVYPLLTELYAGSLGMYIAEELLHIITGQVQHPALNALLLTAAGGYQRGDIDNDGSISISDSTEVLRWLVDLDDAAAPWIKENIITAILKDHTSYTDILDLKTLALYDTDGVKRVSTSTSGISVTGNTTIDGHIDTHSLKSWTGPVEDASGNVRSGRKNLIINGGFDVWQRGTSFTGINSQTYTADRWKNVGNSSIVTASKVSDSTYGQSLRIQHTGSQKWSCVAQVLEVPEYYKGKTITLSMKIKWHNYSSTSYWWLKWGNGSSRTTTNTGTGSGGWETLSWTTTIPSDASDYSGLSLRLHGNQIEANAYDYEIAQVQLELGSVATDFEHRSYGEELALCQRYYQTLGEGSTSGFRFTQRSTTQYPNNYCESFDLGTTMRALPTVTATYLDFHKPGIRYDAITSVSATSRNKRVVELSVNVSTTDNQLITGEVRTLTLTADAEL